MDGTLLNRPEAVQIRFSVDGSTIATGTLRCSATAEDFAALLPLVLTAQDYAASEKIADVPGSLCTRGVPAAYKAKAGDICYYAPWGNLALFYEDGDEASGLILLGCLDSGLTALQRPGAIAMRIERFAR